MTSGPFTESKHAFREPSPFFMTLIDTVECYDYFCGWAKKSGDPGKKRRSYAVNMKNIRTHPYRDDKRKECVAQRVKMFRFNIRSMLDMDAVFLKSIGGIAIPRSGKNGHFMTLTNQPLCQFLHMAFDPAEAGRIAFLTYHGNFHNRASYHVYEYLSIVIIEWE